MDALLAQQRRLEMEAGSSQGSDSTMMEIESKNSSSLPASSIGGQRNTPGYQEVTSPPRASPPFNDTYLAVNKFKLTAGSAPNLLGGAPLNPSSCGSFYLEDDDRHLLCFTNFNFTRKLNVMTSFDVKFMECSCCKKKVLEKRSSPSSGQGERRTFVLCDQNFSPTARSNPDSDKQCLKVIRIENGSLWDLANYYMEMVRSQDLVVPTGSAILIGSASHLADIGLSYYAEEMVAVGRRLSNFHNKGIYFLPCPLLLLGGTEDPEMVRSSLELISWLGNILQKEVGFTPSAMGAVVHELVENEKETAAVTSRRMMLPTSLDSITKKRWASGNANLPTSADPLSVEGEKLIITALIKDINTRFAMNLDSSPNLARKVTGVAAKRSPLYVVVGASHATRTGEALVRAGACVKTVTIPGWRAMKQKVPTMLAALTEVLREVGDNCTVVFQLLDSSFFFARPAEGGLVPICRTGDTFHVHGDLVMAPKEMQYTMFNDIKPILEAAGDRRKIVLSPLPKFLHKPCCVDAEHMPNAKDADFQASMSSDVLDCRRNIKDFNFRAGLRNVRAVGPWSGIQEMGEDVWERDDTHLKPAGYDKIAEMVALTVEEMMERGEAAIRPNPGKRGRDWDDSADRRRGGARGWRGSRLF